VLRHKGPKPPPGPPFFFPSSMYLLYLDASGTDKQQDVSTKHYVLVGLCMHERFVVSDSTGGLQALKDRYRLPGK